MRIIAGKLGGRLFEAPHGHRTHPMGDKVRGALFNILGDIEGLTVLDPFAGSGALSFEAISRGADTATAIEADRSAQTTIMLNIASLQLKNRVKPIKATAQAWLNTYDGPGFDIVLLDPPYDDLQEKTLPKLAALCKPDGVVALSWPAEHATDPPQFQNMSIVVQRDYASAQLIFYSHNLTR